VIFVDEHTKFPLQWGFTIPPLQKRLGTGEAHKKALAEKKALKDAKDGKVVEKEKSKKRKATEAKPDTKEEEKKKKSVPPRTYGTFAGLDVACFYLYQTVLTLNEEYRSDPEHKEPIVSVTLDEVIELVSIAAANKCAEPQEAILYIRKLAQYAHKVDKQKSYAWNGGKINHIDTWAYRNNDAFKQTLASAFEKGLQNCMVNSRVKQTEEDRKKELLKKKREEKKKSEGKKEEDSKEEKKPASKKGKMPPKITVTEEDDSTEESSSADEEEESPVKKHKVDELQSFISSVLDGNDDIDNLGDNVISV
jgi:hypothetical protein